MWNVMRIQGNRNFDTGSIFLTQDRFDHTDRLIVRIRILQNAHQYDITLKCAVVMIRTEQNIAIDALVIRNHQMDAFFAVVTPDDRLMRSFQYRNHMAFLAFASRVIAGNLDRCAITVHQLAHFTRG